MNLTIFNIFGSGDSRFFVPLHVKRSETNPWKKMKQHILIVNDDGINAKGIRSLIEVASDFGDVTVVAPETPMSGMSHSVTMSHPLYLREVRKSKNVDVYACYGTPADCVKLAMDFVLKQKPTLILSGINHGSNANLSVIYSGTMGAATEGSTYGVPSIGFSLLDHSATFDFTASMHFARIIIEKVIKENRNPFLCLNVNIPKLPVEKIKGIKVCRQTKGFWKERFEQLSDPRGRSYFWLKGDFVNAEPESTDTDEWALHNGYVAVVPVSVDMTDYHQLTKMEEWEFEGV